MIDNSYYALFANAAVLISQVLVFDLAVLRWRNDFLEIRRITIGLILGGMTIVLMGFHWKFMPGIIIDTRSVLLSISGLFFGITPTLIAMLVSSIARSLIGGVGVTTGILTIIASGSIAIVWRYIRKKDLQAIGWGELFLMGLVVNGVSLLIFSTLPGGLGKELLSSVGIPVLVVFPIATTVLGVLLLDRLNQYEISNSLHQTQAQLELAFITSKTSFFSFDLEKMEIIRSMEWPLLLGYEVGEMKPDFSSWKKVIFPEERGRIEQLLEDFAVSGDRTFEIASRATDKKGASHWFLVRGFADKFRNGKACSLVGVTVDVTEIKQAEEQAKKSQAALQHQLHIADQSRKALLNLLEDQRLAEEKIKQLNLSLERRVKERTAQLVAANDELEAFAYAVSHDLRAPLRAIDGFSAALQDEINQESLPKAWYYLERIRQASERMSGLIRDLLSFSKVVWKDMERQKIDLSHLALDVAQQMRAEADYAHIQLIVASDLWAEVDPNLMRIVFENLLSNAFKFTYQNPHGSIEIQAEKQLDRLVYSVRDNGVGFDMAYADRIFTPFQRMHHQDDFPGTGVGLATVKRIVGRHGGAIWAESTPGQGATFYFTLNTNSS